MTHSPGALLILCGLPGSGKTAHARRLEAETGAIRFCPDEWMKTFDLDLWDEPRRARIEALQWALAQKLLAAGVDVIIEWGVWGRSERDTLREGARALGARVELQYLTAPAEVLFERVRSRDQENPPIRLDQIEAWARSGQWPDAEEMALFDPPSFVLP